MKPVDKTVVLLAAAMTVFMAFLSPGHTDIMDQVKKAAGIVKKGGDSGLDHQTIVAGLKDALQVGTKKAVDKVSVTNGYYKNVKIKIPLPDEFTTIGKVLRKVGLGKEVDKFELKMNRAAEKAAPMAVDIFWNAVKKMTISDAKRILYSGKDNEATLYFEKHTRGTLYGAFFPIVKDAMDKVGATKLYKDLLKKYNSLPYVKKKEYNVDRFVTNKSLDGLFFMLGNEERQIRKNPAARTTQLLKKVFGSK